MATIYTIFIEKNFSVKFQTGTFKDLFLKNKNKLKNKPKNINQLIKDLETYYNLKSDVVIKIYR